MLFFSYSYIIFSFQELRFYKPHTRVSIRLFWRKWSFNLLHAEKKKVIIRYSNIGRDNKQIFCMLWWRSLFWLWSTLKILLQSTQHTHTLASNINFLWPSSSSFAIGSGEFLRCRLFSVTDVEKIFFYELIFIYDGKGFFSLVTLTNANFMKMCGKKMKIT